ncbi:MAG: hypothetical protein RR310_04025 [Eubacterium sp.]
MIEKQPKKGWYKLDNAGTLYSSIVSSRVSTVYRMTVGLSSEVDPDALQKALDNMMVRFPYFKVTLRRGLFWYYYEHTVKRPIIEKESHYPCKTIKQTKGVFPFRILYYEHYIHLEMSHSICDGYGGLAFLKPLIVEYFRVKEGIICQDLGDIIDIRGSIDPEEFEDSFKKYYKKKVPPPDKEKKAYHLPFSLLDKGQYLLLTGILPVSAVLEHARAYHCTITQFITTLYFESIQDYVLNQVKTKRAKSGYARANIAINVPVDLRSFFPSKTLKNFFISLNPAIDLQLGIYNREEIIAQIKGYMGLYSNPKYINRYVSRNVHNEELVVLRVIPLWVKRMIMPIVYKRYGERAYTSSVSNLGLIKMPNEIKDKITCIESFPPPSAGNKLKIVMCSYGEKMFISFGKTTKEKSIERIFFTKIRKLGIPVKIEGNQLNYYDIGKEV